MRRFSMVIPLLWVSVAFGQTPAPTSAGELSPLQPPTGDIESEIACLDAPCSGGHAVDPDRAVTTRPGGAGRDLQATDRRGIPSSGGSSGTGPTNWPSGPCSPADFAAATGAAFVDLVATSTDACLNTLWTFGSDVEAAISPANVLLIASAIEAEALDLLGNSERLRRMTYFYQIAFYHEFYQPSVAYDAPTGTAAAQAMVAVGQQPDLITVNPPVSLLSQWLVSIDSTNASILLIDQIQAVLERYTSDPAHEGDYQERLMAYRCLFTLARQIGNENNTGGINSRWYSAVPPSLVAAVGVIALDTTYTADSEYVVLNALWVMNRLAFLEQGTRDAAHDILTQAYNIHLPYSGPWLRAVTDLDMQFDGLLYGGGSLDLVQIRADVMAIALPNEFLFDQGRLKFLTAIDLDLANELYDAIQEVESQFYRKSGALDAVPGDSNDVLTLVIYGSPQDYWTYQPFLYGLSTNNGGIFIEGWGTLFTYDRTPAQSIYTLEELLRHEYTHFLDSRYLITGSFGESGTLYEGNRMVWYNEGLAEYLVGSTRIDGVLPRGVLLNQIAGDSSRLTVADITSATYGSFTFYRYAGVYFEFLEEERPGLLMALFDAVLGNDIVILDALYAAMANDPQLQVDYNNFIDAQIAELQQGAGLFAEDVPTTPTPTTLTNDNAGQVLTQLQSVLPAGGSFHVWANRFQYQYSETTPLGGQPIEDYRESTDLALDGQLGQLTGLSDNMTSAVAWFGETTVSADLATSTVVFEGPYSATAADVVAPSAPTGVVAVSANGSVTLSWDQNPELDLSGYFVHRSVVAGGPYSLVNPLPLLENVFVDSEAGAGQLHYVITAIDASSNESLPSVEVTVESTIDILVINGYFDAGNTGYQGSYLDVLDGLGIAYQAWDPFVDGPVTTALLAEYTDGVVIWPVGYFHSGYPDQLGPARQGLLMDYLQDGGNLVLSGAYATAFLDTTKLFTNYLFLQHEQWDMGLPGLLGEPGNPLGEGLDLQLSSGVYQSEMTPLPPAQKAFSYDPLSGTGTLQGGGAAVVTVEEGHKAAVLAFPFSSVVPGDRSLLLERILEWMLPSSPCADPFIRGDTNGSGSVDISDVIFLLDYLFSSGTTPSPEEAGDTNADGMLDISDAIYLLVFLFDSGAPPAAPYPDTGCP